MVKTEAKNALANLLAAQPEAGIAKEKDVVAFERLLTEVAKRAAEVDQAQTLLSDKVFDNLFTYLSDNVTLWAPSESAKALDPDDGLLYSTLDVLLSASDSLPVPLAEACVEHLHSLVDIVMSTDLHPEAQELSVDLINHALREQTKACKAKFHADAGEDSSCAALLQGAEGVLMRAASLGLQLRLVDLLVSLGKRARDVIGGLFGSQFALGHGPEFVQTAFRCLSAFNAAHSTAVTPVTARISSAFGCRIKSASGVASCEVSFGNRGAIEVLAQEGGPLFDAQQAQHGLPLKFRLGGVTFDEPGTLTLNVDMAKVRDLFDDRAANGTLRLVLSGADAERLRSRVLPVLPAKLLTGGEPKAKPRQSLPSRKGAKKDVPSFPSFDKCVQLKAAKEAAAQTAAKEVAAGKGGGSKAAPQKKQPPTRPKPGAVAAAIGEQERRRSADLAAARAQSEARSRRAGLGGGEDEDEDEEGRAGVPPPQAENGEGEEEEEEEEEEEDDDDDDEEDEDGDGDGEWEWEPANTQEPPAAKGRRAPDAAHGGRGRAKAAESATSDYKKLKVAELKELLAARDLKLSGKKDDLIARLEAADRLSATPPPPAAPPIARKVKASAAAAASHSAAEFESWSKVQDYKAEQQLSTEDIHDLARQAKRASRARAEVEELSASEEADSEEAEVPVAKRRPARESHGRTLDEIKQQLMVLEQLGQDQARASGKSTAQQAQRSLEKEGKTSSEAVDTAMGSQEVQELLKKVVELKKAYDEHKGEKRQTLLQTCGECEAVREHAESKGNAAAFELQQEGESVTRKVAARAARYEEEIAQANESRVAKIAKQKKRRGPPSDPGAILRQLKLSKKLSSNVMVSFSGDEGEEEEP